MNEEKKRPEQETKAPAQIDITPGEPTAPAAEEPILTEESPAAEAPQTEKAGQTAPVLCSPLIVHKEGDASYQPDAVEDGMTATHTEDELEAPTIERHRFRKKKKNHKGAYALILLLVAACTMCTGSKIIWTPVCFAWGGCNFSCIGCRRWLHIPVPRR